MLVLSTVVLTAAPPELTISRPVFSIVAPDAHAAVGDDLARSHARATADQLVVVGDAARQHERTAAAVDERRTGPRRC